MVPGGLFLGRKLGVIMEFTLLVFLSLRDHDYLLFTQCPDSCPVILVVSSRKINLVPVTSS
jgi:hypothetical protein